MPDSTGRNAVTDQSTTARPAVDTDGVFVSADGVPLTLWWDSEAAPGGALRLVDQTRLPGEYVVLDCAEQPPVEHAIRTLQVRGAPAIGVAAGYGLALGARSAFGSPGKPLNAPAALAQLEALAARLRATRPTAVNLGWALDRQLAVARRLLDEGLTGEQLCQGLLAEAHQIAAEDAAACRAMGEYGAALIAASDVLLTHCNAGALATSGMGTALAPIFVAHARGMAPRVFVDETRPVLQGARLTAWELTRAGITATLITDNMAAHFMRRGGIRAVFVGADRIAANGDVANKIGTYGLAVLARAHDIAFYVVAPRSTIDRSLPSGDAIPIEQRSPDEVTTVRGVRLAPAGMSAANPAFDVTPAEYITALVTEAGIARPPYPTSIAALFNTSVRANP